MYKDTLLTGGVSIAGIEAVDVIPENMSPEMDIIKLALQALIAVSAVGKMWLSKKKSKKEKQNDNTKNDRADDLRSE